MTTHVVFVKEDPRTPNAGVRELTDLLRLLRGCLGDVALLADLHGLGFTHADFHVCV